MLWTRKYFSLYVDFCPFQNLLELPNCQESKEVTRSLDDLRNAAYRHVYDVQNLYPFTNYVLDLRAHNNTGVGNKGTVTALTEEEGK